MNDVIDHIETKRRIAANLRKRLEDLGWSQAYLAQVAGEDNMTVSRILRAMTDPRVSTLSRLAECLGMTLDECLAPVKSGHRKKSTNLA